MKTRLKKEDKIREAAYYFWLQNPDAPALDNWLAAEKEYKQKHCRKDKNYDVMTTEYCNQQGDYTPQSFNEECDELENY